MILLLNEDAVDGDTIYDDGVSRAAELAPGLFLIAAAGRSVQFDVLSTDGAILALRAKAPACTVSIVEAARALLDHVAEGLPADG